jgi:6-phosphogluconolactonase
LLAACSGASGGSDATPPDGGSIVADAVADAGSLADATALDAPAAPDAAPPDLGAPDASPFDAEPADAGAERLYAYVGSGSGEISVFALDPSSGALDPRGQIPGGANPSFLAFSADRRFLYAVNEGGGGGQVAAFAIDPDTGGLSFLNRVPSEGSGPTHLTIDGSGRFVLVANYGDGTVAVLPIQADGRLGAAVDTEAPGQNAHQVVTDPANAFLLVPCLGSNWVAQLELDPATGQLTPNAVPTVDSAPGAGPRHLAFHPGGRWVYAINERDSTITRYDFDPATGRLSPDQSVSTLPVGFSGNNTGAEIAVHPSGALVFSSNRGHDSIAIFRVDAADGRLTPAGHAPTGGRTPRHFSLTPDGALLLAANQQSGDIHAFRVDPSAATLTPLGPVAQVNRPAFVGVTVLP